MPDFISNLVFDVGVEALARHVLERHRAVVSRLILFDKRGTGLSDRVPPTCFRTLETRMEDVRAVLDAVDSRAGGHLRRRTRVRTMSVLYAATYPERTIALALFHGAASTTDLRDSTIGLVGSGEAGERSRTLEMLARDRATGPSEMDLEERRNRFDERDRGSYGDEPRRGASPALNCAMWSEHPDRPPRHPV